MAATSSTPNMVAFAKSAIQSTRRYDMPVGGVGTWQQSWLMTGIRNPLAGIGSTIYAYWRTCSQGRRRCANRALLRARRPARGAGTNQRGLPRLRPSAPRAAQFRAPLPLAPHAARGDQAPDRPFQKQGG